MARRSACISSIALGRLLSATELVMLWQAFRLAAMSLLSLVWKASRSALVTALTLPSLEASVRRLATAVGSGGNASVDSGSKTNWIVGLDRLVEGLGADPPSPIVIALQVCVLGLHGLNIIVIVVEARDSRFVAFAALGAGSWTVDAGGVVELAVGGENLFVFVELADGGCYNHSDVFGVAVDSNDPVTFAGDVTRLMNIDSFAFRGGEEDVTDGGGLLGAGGCLPLEWLVHGTLGDIGDINNRDLFYAIALLPHQLPGIVDPRRWHCKQSQTQSQCGRSK
jgi:hypothetical protein